MNKETATGRRVLLNRLYASYSRDGTFAPYRYGEGRLVSGDGPVFPKLMLLGMVPGTIDQRTGHPYSGKPGDVLDKLLASVSLTRDDVYLTTLVKYRRRGGIAPGDVEKRSSLPYLRSEHRLVGYPPLVLLGGQVARAVQALSMRTVILPDAVLKQDRWSWLQFANTQGFPILPLQDPAVGVYQGTKMPGLLRGFQNVLNPPTYNIF